MYFHSLKESDFSQNRVYRGHSQHLKDLFQSISKENYFTTSFPLLVSRPPGLILSLKIVPIIPHTTMHCAVHYSADCRVQCSAAVTGRGESRHWLQWLTDARPCHTSPLTSMIAHLDTIFHNKIMICVGIILIPVKNKAFV